jgi:hypothetical protein
LPTTCFGETDYFVDRFEVINAPEPAKPSSGLSVEPAAPPAPTSAPAAVPPPAQP